jgi:hypothetical protein
MGEGSQKTIEDAQKVADFLDTIGQHKRSNDIRRLCRSNSGMRTCLKLLRQDNMELRAKIEAPQSQEAR